MFILKKYENPIISNFFGERSSFKTVYKANLLKIFFMAMSSSNAFAGVLIFIPFLNKTGELFGEKYKDLLFSSLDLTPHIKQTGLPPFVAGLAGLMVTGLIISVITVMLSYGFLKIQYSSQGDNLLIKRGIIQKNIFITSINKIIAFQIKNSLLMTLIKKCNLKIYACGQHREKGNKRVVAPFLSAKKGEAFFDLNLTDPSQIFFGKPPLFTQKTYLYLPFVLMCCLWASCISAIFLGFDFSAFYPLILFVFLLLFVFFTMRIFAHKKAFLYGDNIKIVISFYKRFSFTKTLIPLSKIQGIKISQSIFQRYRNLCTVCIYIYGEKKRCFKIKHLKLSDGLKFSKFINHNPLKNTI